MGELIDLAKVSQQLPLTLLVAGLVFGLSPGLMLRLIVFMYAHGDPRRRAVFSELYSLGYIARIVWVFQQLEIAISEGLAPRLQASWESGTKTLCATAESAAASTYGFAGTLAAARLEH